MNAPMVNAYAGPSTGTASHPPSAMPPNVGGIPTMRRKSSAQNLLSLSSFKSTPPPINPTANMPSYAANAVYGAGAQTPTTPRPGDWDLQSVGSHGDVPPGQSSATVPGQGASVEQLRDTVQKRIITLTYLRSVHEGRSHWFHTIMMSRGDLDRQFSNSEDKYKKRTYRFAILGMSLSVLLDINSPQDLLRGMLNTLSEYDQWKEDSDKPKMGRLFRSRVKRAQGGMTDYTMSSTDASDSSLVIPHMPFQLDYHQTLLSLLDVISECYNKIGRILGPSPFPHTSQHMMGPLGMLSPQPGVSYLFDGPNSNSGPGGDGSLWGIAHASAVGGMGAPASAMNAHGALGSPPPSWTQASGDTVQKIDRMFKKITTGLLKELDHFARDGIRDELASLDPMLRNVQGAGNAERDPYDFIGNL